MANEFVIRRGLISLGGITFPLKQVSTTYVITSDDYLIEATSGTFNITLPTAVGVSGKIYAIKNSGSGTITVNTTSSQTIDGSLTITLSQYSNLEVESNGSNWIQVGRSGTSGTSGTSGISASVGGTPEYYSKFDTSGTSLVDSSFPIVDDDSGRGAVLLGNASVLLGSERYYEIQYSKHRVGIGILGGANFTTFDSHNIIQNSEINPSSTVSLMIDPTNSYNFSFSTSDRIYGIELYLIGSEVTSQNVDYRTYTGAIKNIAGTLSLVGSGFTERVSAQDASLWTANITISGTDLDVQITNIAGDPIVVSGRVEIVSNNILP